MRALLPLILLSAGPAHTQGLTCTFTNLCSLQTGCQTSDGIDLSFDTISGALALVSADGLTFGTPLSHVTPPTTAFVFEGANSDTILLTLADDGTAAMSHHIPQPASRLQALTYYGTCVPGSAE